jgi:hypothetical protein
MLVELGCYDHPETVIDLDDDELAVRLGCGDDGAQSELIPCNFKGFEIPLKDNGGSKTYLLGLAGRVPRESGVYVWSWVAQYYWHPHESPKQLARRATLSVARLNRLQYRFELESYGVVTQYVLHQATVIRLEKLFNQSKQL